MASFLTAKGTSKHNRKVSHGGLGGCVPVKPRNREHADTSKSSWALRRKKRPAVVDIDVDRENLTISTMTPTSIVLHDTAIPESLDSPLTEDMKPAQLEEKIMELLSSAGHHETAEKSSVFVGRPQTPPTPEQTAVLPIELPGSILLPSQGFPQENPPITPARNKFESRESEESTRSQTPSLDSSPTTDGEMDIFKNLTAPQKRSGRANTFPTSPVKIASKPFTAMSAEELLQCLPELNMSVISHSWLPAMENELKKIKELLQDAAEVRLQSQANLEIFGSVSLYSYKHIPGVDHSQDVNSIAVSARDISRTYFDAMQRVRPLADRDAKEVMDQLEFTQVELQNALAVIEENKNIISDKESLIRRLHETLAANARTFAGFIQDHVGSRLNNLHDIRTQEIMQLIQDQQQNSPDSGTHTPGRYVRISEKLYNSYLQRLRNTQEKVETYSKIANDQLELLKSQSADLDKRMEEYEKCLTILQKRHDRILELESKVEANEAELDEAREAAEAFEALKETHESLGKHCTDLEWTLESIKNGFKKQLEDRDTEIFTLRQHLGDAVLESAALKADLKALTPQGSVNVSTRFKNSLRFGRSGTNQDRNTPILTRRALHGGKLPASQSMLSLNTSKANSRSNNTLILGKTPGPLSEPTRPSGDSFGEKGSGKLLSGLRLNPPDTAASDKTAVIRPRKDSLHTTNTTPTTGGARPRSMLIDYEKALPSPPAVEFQDFHLDVEQDSGTRSSPAVPTHTTPITSSPRKRVLSGITEMSFEDENGPEKKSPASTSSSDKNAFRSSIAIMERFDTTMGAAEPSQAGHLEFSTMEEDDHGHSHGPCNDDDARTSPPLSAGSRYYNRVGEEEISPTRSARELYHDQSRISGWARGGWGRSRT